jgi:hypothetical protein
MVVNIVDVGWATSKSGCLPISEKGERRKEKGEKRKEKGERRKEKVERRKEIGERRNGRKLAPFYSAASPQQKGTFSSRKNNW